MYFLYFIRGLAPNFRQDSIRSGYISDHESRSGYEHRGEYDTGGRASGHTIYPCLFQIRTSGTLLTFDKVKLSLSYMTCCACFRSSNKRSPLPCDISNVLTINISSPIPGTRCQKSSQTQHNPKQFSKIVEAEFLHSPLLPTDM